MISDAFLDRIDVILEDIFHVFIGQVEMLGCFPDSSHLFFSIHVREYFFRFRWRYHAIFFHFFPFSWHGTRSRDGTPHFSFPFFLNLSAENFIFDSAKECNMRSSKKFPAITGANRDTREDIAKKRELVSKLVQQGYIDSDLLEKAMLDIPRKAFVPSNMKPFAYTDKPLPIGKGQTISAPHMYAMMTSAMNFTCEPLKILEIGTGSGYQSAILAEMIKSCGSKSHVYSVERIPELSRKAGSLLEKLGYGKIVKTLLSNGTIGYKKHAPYDRILATAAAPHLPDDLIDQLADDGALLIPIGIERQSMFRFTKRKDGLYKENLGSVSFVPMIGKKGFEER